MTVFAWTNEVMYSYFLGVAEKVKDYLYPIYFEYSVKVEEEPIGVINVTVTIHDIVYDKKGKSCDFVNKVKGYFWEAKDFLPPIITQHYSKLRLRIDIKQSDDCLPVAPLISQICKEEKSMMLSVPEVKEIRHTKSKKKGDLFTVVWADDTQTTIKLMEGDTPDDLRAFMYCASIKMFGSKGECRKYVAEKQDVFKDRVRRRSEEIRTNRQRRNFEMEQRKNAPYAGGLCIPALAKSSAFKRNRGGNE